MRKGHVFKTYSKKLYMRTILAPILGKWKDLTKELLVDLKLTVSSPTILQTQTGNVP